MPLRRCAVNQARSALERRGRPRYRVSTRAADARAGVASELDRLY